MEKLSSLKKGEKIGNEYLEEMYELKHKQWHDRKKETEESGALSQVNRKASKKRPVISSSKKRPRVKDDGIGEVATRGGDIGQLDSAKQTRPSRLPTPREKAILPHVLADTGTTLKEDEENFLEPLQGIPGPESPKFLRSVLKSIPSSYKESLKGNFEGAINPIQYALIEALVRLEGAKVGKARTEHELKAAKKEIGFVIDSAMYSTMKLDMSTRATMDVQAESLVNLKAEYEKTLIRCKELVTERDLAFVERDQAKREADAWKKSAEEVKQLKIDKVALIKDKDSLDQTIKEYEEAASNFKDCLKNAVLEGEKGYQEKVCIAWEKAFPDHSFSWF